PLVDPCAQRRPATGTCQSPLVARAQLRAPVGHSHRRGQHRAVRQRRPRRLRGGDQDPARTRRTFLRSPLAEASICPWGPNQCLQAYVWRVITPDDLAYVTPEMRDLVTEDNALAEERKDPACATAAALAQPGAAE